MALFNPTDKRTVHFMGIGGAGMSALALIARRRGVAVSGCDVDPSGAADLSALGVMVSQGHDGAHLVGARAVVVTAAVPPGHPELERARELGLLIVPRKVALAELIQGAHAVGVAGTHGKTTTTVMTTEALTAAGLNPTGIAGGRVSSWGGNARVAGDELFVVEADEFDQAFLTLYPTVAVVNNVEPDHLECYGTMDVLENAFVEFAGRARIAIACADDPGARKVAERVGKTVRKFGLAADADIRITDVVQRADRTEARIVWRDGRSVALRLQVPGLHNLRNAVAALGVVDALEAPLEPAAAALGEFSGVGRRFERLGEFSGVAVVDDYAHHPSELAATLSAARQAFPGRRLVAVFQPHLYSRTAAHGQAMGEALAAADLVIVTEIYPAREQPIAGVSGRQVADAAGRAGADAHFEPTRAEVGKTVYRALRAGDVVLTLGAGDITRVAPELVRWLSAA
ncbi:MAG TPA: UDP-N-acetylmuramate--L-alanine ligase [Gemmatimonadales bacterium]|jgi:UDP-N-acetylmuramate--alanine ligase|nr:UDP-N-acetylmuramate--L-alanine ligase [Gemmatimonadales bacterium]